MSDHRLPEIERAYPELVAAVRRMAACGVNLTDITTLMLWSGVGSTGNHGLYVHSVLQQVALQHGAKRA